MLTSYYIIQTVTNYETTTYDYIAEALTPPLILAILFIS